MSGIGGAVLGSLATIYKFSDRLNGFDKKLTEIENKIALQGAEIKAEIARADTANRYDITATVQKDVLEPLKKLEAAVNALSTQVAVLNDRGLRQRTSEGPSGNPSQD